MAVALFTTGQYHIAYQEVLEGYRERWSEQQSEITRRFRCAWVDGFKFVLDIVGWTDPAYDPTTGRLKRYLPMQDPETPGFYAVSMDLVNTKGVPNQTAAGLMTVDQRNADGSLRAIGTGDGYAEYDVRFIRPLYNVLADNQVTSEVARYVIPEYTDSIDNLTLPGQGYRYAPVGNVGLPPGTAIPVSIAGATIPQKTTKAFPFSTLSLTWLEVPATTSWPIAGDTALGKVNSDTLTFRGKTYAAGTMLYHSVKRKIVRRPSSVFYWEIAYIFHIRPVNGWNRIYNRPESDFFQVIPAKVGSPSLNTSPGIYEYAEMGPLFTFP